MLPTHRAREVEAPKRKFGRLAGVPGAPRYEDEGSPFCSNTPGVYCNNVSVMAPIGVIAQIGFLAPGCETTNKIENMSFDFRTAIGVIAPDAIGCDNPDKNPLRVGHTAVACCHGWLRVTFSVVTDGCGSRFQS